MKAITAVCATGASVPAIANGRVQRHREGENAEIQMYLSKLKDLVPFMPKNRKISKLEVIQNVIDYICDLQNALESHPSVNNFAAVQALAGQNQQMEQYSESTPVSPRQPLGVRSSPNTILSNNTSSTTLNSSSTNISSSSNNSDLTSLNNNNNNNNMTREKTSC